MTYSKYWTVNRMMRPDSVDEVIEAIRYFNSHGITTVSNEDLSLATGYTISQIQRALKSGIAQGLIERTIIPSTRHLVAKKGDAA